MSGTNGDQFEGLANFDVALDGIREWIAEGSSNDVSFSKVCREGFMDNLLEVVKDLDGAIYGINNVVCTSQ
jgi:hypothetical protein